MVPYLFSEGKKNFSVELNLKRFIGGHLGVLS